MGVGQRVEHKIKCLTPLQISGENSVVCVLWAV